MNAVESTISNPCIICGKDMKDAVNALGICSDC
jgi:hypothetical protein